MAVQIKTWIADNVKWIITLIVIGISNYFILMGQVNGNTERIETESKRVDKIEIWKEETAKNQIIKENLANKQIHEIQLNLKSLMKKNGLDYLSITE